MAKPDDTWVGSIRRLSIPSVNRTLCGLTVLPMVALVGYRLVEALFYSPLNADAGCFLPLAERIAEGSVPYRDLHPGYAPLSFIILGMLRKLSGDVTEPYLLYLGATLFVEVIDAALIVLLSTHFSKNLFLGIFAATAFLAGCFLHEGSHFFLEPYVILFSLSSMLYFLSGPPTRHRLILSGALVGCAFLCKQYGLAGIVPLAVGSFSGRESLSLWLSRMVWLSVGAILPTAILLSALVAFYGISFTDIVSGLWVSDYIRSVSALTWVKNFFFVWNLYLLPIPLLLCLPAFRQDRMFVMLVSALVAFMAPSGIRDFGHYCMLFLPYGVLLGAYLVTCFESSSHRLVRFASLLVLCSLSQMSYKTYHTLDRPRDPSYRVKQYQLAERVSQVWSPGSQVILFGEPWITFAANFRPAGLPRLSYSFLISYPPKELERTIRDGCAVFVDTKSQEYFTQVRAKLEETVGDFYLFLKESGYELKQTHQGRYQFWVRSCVHGEGSGSPTAPIITSAAQRSKTTFS